ncbi:MAG TPA: helix-turn-helix domain-containing protein, partial [Thermaerobacter sp.]
LSPREVAGLFEVTERTVRKWCAQGKIVAFQPAGRGGEWRIPVDQFAATPEQIRAFRQATREIAARYGGPIDDFER